MIQNFRYLSARSQDLYLGWILRNFQILVLNLNFPSLGIQFTYKPVYRGVNVKFVTCIGVTWCGVMWCALTRVRLTMRLKCVITCSVCVLKFWLLFFYLWFLIFSNSQCSEWIVPLFQLLIWFSFFETYRLKFRVKLFMNGARLWLAVDSWVLANQKAENFFNTYMPSGWFQHPTGIKSRFWKNFYLYSINYTTQK